jgi:carotenoid cleavage dioxygenase
MEERTGASELWVIDAQRVEAEPVARVKIPTRVPTGYHTCWVPA